MIVIGFKIAAGTGFVEGVVVTACTGFVGGVVILCLLSLITSKGVSGGKVSYEWKYKW